MYHGLLRDGERADGERASKYWLPRELFAAHLRRAAQDGRRVGLLREVWALGAPATDPGPPVALTFDDGRASDYEVAFPALTEAGAVADFFVNTTTVGRPGFVSWAQIMEMQRSGCSFQSHSHDHVALLWLSRAALENQLDRSKRMLEDRLGSPVSFLAAPYGLINRRVVEMARKVGYRAVCNSLSWPARPGRSPINRIAMHRDTSVASLARLLHGDPLAFVGRVVRAGAAYVPKRVLLRVQPARLGVRVLEIGA
jgi:peptidoglycan/xylan/chitin deacetylase (PgdA/CDA1 family)